MGVLRVWQDAHVFRAAQEDGAAEGWGLPLETLSGELALSLAGFTTCIRIITY